MRICEIYGGDGCVSAAARQLRAQPSLHVTAPFEHKYMSVGWRRCRTGVPVKLCTLVHNAGWGRFACSRTLGIMKEIKNTYMFLYHTG